MTRTTPQLTPPLQTSAPQQREDVCPVSMAQYTTDIRWNLVPNPEPSAPKAETLPLGYRRLATYGNQLHTQMKWSLKHQTAYYYLEFITVNFNTCVQV
ncbi:hypothetical protein AVEN_190617-1 [Araneus ventricosus]|uniref:Uncharacterized protein n=1 Tax=Araneus ventricosus TaxID=182803 RepID=A0A4Y2CEN0_ARAVE|nr:hypothetical protein AVEN_190617-1 [Araneus ventricosus]